MPASDPLPDTTIEQLPERLRDAVARAGWLGLSLICSPRGT